MRCIFPSVSLHILCFLSVATGFLGNVERLNAQSTSEIKWNLRGKWELDVGSFNYQNGVCTVRDANGTGRKIPVIFQQNKNEFIARASLNDNNGTVIGKGKITGDEFTAYEYNPTLEWKGSFTKRVDTNNAKIITEISGDETCNNQATIPFILRRIEKPVYNYIYINGINTPRGSANDFRGSCLAEKRMVQEFLINRTRLRDETNRLLDTDCNYSGFDNPLSLKAILNGVPLSVGDIWQALLQTQGSKNPTTGARVFSIKIAPDLLSSKIVKQMINIVKQEENNSQSNERNYFILVAHSQGNLFAEKVAGELTYAKDKIGQKLVKRLRIIAIASPTDYKYSHNTNHASTRVRVEHFTRCDDIILSLANIKIPSLQSARPLPGNLQPPLRRDGKCVVPNLLASKDPLLGDNVKAHFLDEYFKSASIVEKITNRLIAVKRNLLYEE